MWVFGVVRRDVQLIGETDFSGNRDSPRIRVDFARWGYLMSVTAMYELRHGDNRGTGCATLKL